MNILTQVGTGSKAVFTPGPHQSAHYSLNFCYIASFLFGLIWFHIALNEAHQTEIEVIGRDYEHSHSFFQFFIPQNVSSSFSSGSHLQQIIPGFTWTKTTNF